MFKIMLAAIIMLFCVSVAIASPRTGIRPEGICTRDLNLWGNASQCSCAEGQVYDERAGLCLEGLNSKEILAQGALSANLAAIGGETTGFAIKTPEDDVYELILKVPDREKLKKLDGMYIEVAGELITITSVERKGRKAIIVEKLAVLE